MRTSLSATRTISLPKVVPALRERAIQPSTRAVSDATAKTIAASRSPFGVSSSSATTSTGTSRMRTTVRTLGTLSGNNGSTVRPRGSGLQTPARAEQPRAPRDHHRRERAGDAEREQDADVAGAQELVAHRLHEVEDRVGV